MKVYLTALCVLCLFAVAATVTLAADEKKDARPVTGILIDRHCGDKMMAKDDPEAAAADHPRSCAMKDACEKSGYAVIVGKQMYKFNEHGNDLAKDFLKKSTKEKDLRVTVEGTRDGDEIKVDAIAAAPDKK